MTDTAVQYTEALTLGELDSISAGGGPPGWWWLVTFAVSESQSFLDGLSAGFNAA